MKDVKRLAIIVGLCLTCAVALVAGVAAVTAFAYQNRLSPRTIIAGESVGNMSTAEAERIIAAKQNSLTAATLTLTYNDKTEAVPLTELGVVIAGPELNVLLAPNNQWDWLDLNYWSNFFGKKEIGLLYEIDKDVAQKKIETVFGVTSTAQSAALAVNNGLLEVVPSRVGESIGLDLVVAAVGQLLRTGSADAVPLAAAEVAPSVTTEVVNRTKTEIEAALQPIYLAGDGRNFMIPEAHLYDLIDYQTSNGQLLWSINNDKLQGYLASKIAGRINLKMVEKLIQSDTQQVTQEGRDGKSVDMNTLISAVKRTITEQTPTKDAPIQIGVVTTAFTQKTVEPDYVPGLVEGLYIDVNLSKQRLFIMNGTTKVAQYLISSGKRGTPTPVGRFYIKNKIALAQSRLFPGIWMEKWNALAKNSDGSGYEGYGLHRVPCFDSACNSREPSSHLGRPVSHGCVRIEDSGADWVYDNAPVGTLVNIHL
ncbi:MAG: L,D-transpeptidase [Candidatus Berkelbacteria bacterium]|nr:MAG: L,D-transpeptidase [Candidatus Berkelbacteria bacterium]QQG51821.1 MAG: L,D-transpeptidase [Candidatus Berkelbacteria bacterium]